MRVVLVLALRQVSSHTPAWGVSSAATSRTPPTCFKSYPRVGGISGGSSEGVRPFLFQVIPPRGGYQVRGFTRWVANSFKSYPRVGGIELAKARQATFYVSSHTPAWGVSSLNPIHRLMICVSSHTPAWGVSSLACPRSTSSEFQVIPPRGGYPCCPCRGVCPPCFKSYPRVGGIV